MKNTHKDLIQKFIKKLDYLYDYKTVNERQNIIKDLYEIAEVKCDIQNDKISLPTTKEIKKAKQEYDKRAYFGHFAGDDPWKHFQAGVEWVLARIDNKLVNNEKIEKNASVYNKT